MRSYIFRFAVMVVALGLLPEPVWAEFPGRKSGLWETVTSGDGIPEAKLRECVDQVADRATVAGPKEVPGLKCQVSSAEGGASGFNATVTCDMSGTKMVVKSLGRGDFASAVTYTITTTFDPPFMGQTSRTMKIDAKYLGQCPAGTQPGDVEMLDGTKFSKADQDRLAKKAEGMMSNPEMQAALKRAAEGQ